MGRWQQILGGALVLASALLSGCTRDAGKPAKPAPPAKVAHAVKETELNTVVLTEEAEKRLRLKVATAQVQDGAVRRVRFYGGEVTLPASALLTVSAPVTGTLRAPKKEELPHVGSVVKQGETMFTLVPHALTQAEQINLEQVKVQLATMKIDAEGQVKQAHVQVDAAKVAFNRAERLYRESAGTKKELDDAEAALLLAQKGLDAALLKKSTVDNIQIDTDKGSVKPLVLAAPRPGIVRATYAVPGEMVHAGAPLFEIMNVDTVWIKVPVYVGEAAEIAEKEPAKITDLADPSGARGVPASPVKSPPTAQAQASAVDLYYELPNPGGKYRPGERVCALLPLKGDEKSISVPWKSIVYDIDGGTWVYVKKADRTYVRQRVEVRYVDDGRAVLRKGPAPGTEVVTDGAEEVFGAEFGYGK
jgi:RND family efflux transporter MFP subunit